MSNKVGFTLLVLSTGLAAATLATVPAAEPAPTLSYTDEQAARGAVTFKEKCSTCHGDQLDNGEVAPPLKGKTFLSKWGGKGLDEPFAIMSTQMPPTEPGALGPDAYVDVLSFILSQNGIPSGAAALPSDPDKLKSMHLPQAKP